MLEGQNICVLDLETLHSADNCRHCGHAQDSSTCRLSSSHRYEKIGWDNKQALGLSIGCYFDYQDSLYHWFDVHTLESTMRLFVERQPMLVSFNGIQFDFSLMRAILHRLADGHEQGEGEPPLEAWAQDLHSLCDSFKTLCASSYDILARIWQADPARKFERGLNSLGAISVANDFGKKEMDGAHAPRLWAQERYAEVMNYCQGDVWKTKMLFEQILTKGSILRGDGLPIVLPWNLAMEKLLHPFVGTEAQHAVD